ncbi:MAG: regulatory protein RecX [Clostridia bacterium]|nr:regulatory protein RecX [Clostridia bacterium]
MTAKDYAVKLIGFCDRSEKEIREKILKKGYSEAECEEAIAFCREYSFIDDERFAEHFAHDAVNLKKLGKARIKMELRHKGVEEEIIENALCDIEDEKEMLKKELQRKFGNLDLTDKKVKNKVFGYFARRGFKTSDILYAMNEEYDGYE